MKNQAIHQYRKTEQRFFYGYIVVIAAFFIMLVGYGLYTIFGVFFEPMLTEFGWTKATTSGAFSPSVILGGLLGILIGGLTDRFGSRIVLTVCGCFLGVGFFLCHRLVVSGSCICTGG